MISARISRSFRRPALALALCVAGAASIAARPAAPGVTYRVRFVMTPPDMPGMTMSPSVVVGRGTTLGSLTKLEIDSVSGQMLPMTIGDYMLSLDSGRVVTVSPSSKTYSEDSPALGGLPPDLLASASFQNVNVTSEKLGPGEPMQGFPTEKYRITTSYVLSIMGTMINSSSTADMWVAQLPGTVTTMFDGAMPASMSQGPMKELVEKTIAARKIIGKGTSLKTVTTSNITGPMSATTTTTVELVDVKTADVDPATFKVPEGFTKKP